MQQLRRSSGRSDKIEISLCWSRVPSPVTLWEGGRDFNEITQRPEKRSF